jgi:hypothetical protein
MSEQVPQQLSTDFLRDRVRDVANRVLHRSQHGAFIDQQLESGPIDLHQAEHLVNNIAQQAKLVLKALEHIGKAHPFIRGMIMIIPNNQPHSSSALITKCTIAHSRCMCLLIFHPLGNM